MADTRDRGVRALAALHDAGLMMHLTRAAICLRDAGLLPPHPTAPDHVVLKVDLGDGVGICVVASAAKAGV